MASKPRARRSLAGRIAVVVTVTAAAVAAVTIVFDRWLHSPGARGRGGAARHAAARPVAREPAC